MFFSDPYKHWPWIVAFAGACLALTLAIENSYYQLIMANLLVWAVMGLAWNLLSGYSGLISFGHAAFFGLGAYFVVLAQVFWNLTPWIGIPVAAVLGGLAGIVVGLPTFRLRGHYFALAMLAYPLALLYVFEWLGHQEVAIPMVRDAPAAFMQFDDRRIYVLIALALTIAAICLTRRLERGRYGMALRAIKQDETAAEAAGIDTLTWKLRSIALSGGMASAVGGLYAVIQLIVTPLSVFGVLVSAQALIVAMFGGVGTVWGPVIGASILVPLSAWLDAELAEVLPGIQGVVYGVAIIGVILLAPEGVFWKVRDILMRRGWIRSDSIVSPIPPDRAGAAARFRDAVRTQDEKWQQDGDESGVPLLRARALSRAFGGLRAVDGVDLVVRRGEILGVIGPNGAGKTTLFNLINGFIDADSGHVEFGGATISGRRPNRICASGIGRTFQVVKPFARMTIADNVIVGAYVHARNIEAARATAADAIAIVGLTEVAGKIAGGATNLELRLMEIARSLASRPKLLLLDEVFAGLTREEVEAVSALIRDLAAMGITLAIIEHTMHAMVQLVDRFVVLDHGRVLAEGPPEQITRDPAVIEAYLGKKWLNDA